MTLNIGINHSYRKSEQDVVQNLLAEINLSEAQQKNISQYATLLVKNLREEYYKSSVTNKIMNQYNLSSKEGIALMALAESLIRTPDQIL